MEQNKSPPTVIQFTPDEPKIDLDFLKSPCCGALVMFQGMTRATTGFSSCDNIDHQRSVISLVYDGYESMFYKIIQSIIDETRIKWPSIWGVGVAHRIGNCPLGNTGECYNIPKTSFSILSHYRGSGCCHSTTSQRSF